MLDREALLRELASSPRPVVFREGSYFEDSKLRSLKGRTADHSTLRDKEPPLSDATRDALRDAEVLVTLDVPADFAELASKLRFVQFLSAGCDHAPKQKLAALGIRQSTGAGVGNVSIAEFVIGRVIEVYKEFRRIEADQAAHNWRRTAGRSLDGDTIGIVGLGAIGTEIASRARAFGMRVLATRRSYTPGMTSPLVDELYGPDGLAVLLERSDVLVLCAPSTDETRDLIGAAELARMRKGATLCNVARGTLVDESALAGALRNGHLGAAIIDVTRVEPLPADDPLWDAPNLYISSHTSVAGDAYMRRFHLLVVDNILRYLNGEPLRNELVVDS